MKYEFEVYQMKVEDHLFWVAKSKILEGCVGQGETTVEAVNELEGNEFEWLETAKQCGIPIPDMHVRTDSPQYSGKISLRFSPSFTNKLLALQRNRVSILISILTMQSYTTTAC